MPSPSSSFVPRQAARLIASTKWRKQHIEFMKQTRHGVIAYPTPKSAYNPAPHANMLTYEYLLTSCKWVNPDMICLEHKRLHADPNLFRVPRCTKSTKTRHIGNNRTKPEHYMGWGITQRNKLDWIYMMFKILNY